MLTKAPMKKLLPCPLAWPLGKILRGHRSAHSLQGWLLIERCAAPQGKPGSWPRYRVLWQDAAKSVVAFHLYTGRTHQIRVHAAFMGHPLSWAILSMAQRGPKSPCPARDAAQFRHPLSGKDVKITDPSLPFFLPANKAFAPCISKKGRKDEGNMI